MIQDGLKWVSAQFFSLDPEVRDEIADLPDKILQVELTPLDMRFYIQPSQDGLVLLLHCDRVPDAIVRGTPLAFAKMSIMQRMGGDSRSADIEIQGDAEFVHQINLRMKKFRIDWEELLADVVGDRIAQPIAANMRSASDYTKKSAQAMQENITEFIQEELKVLPPREAINDFMIDVDAIRDRVERLEALMRLLREENE